MATSSTSLVDNEGEFDPHQADVYVQHLADLNEIQEVIASEDIFNEFGVLLVPKGTRIKKSVADRLMGHKVEKPVHQVVSLSGCLNAQTLYNAFEELLTQYPDLQAMQVKNKYENKLKHLCTRSTLPLGLLQKVTVMKERLPEIFQQTLFTAWLGSMIASEMHMDLETIYDTFLSALFHDIGLLHIDENLVKKESELTHHEWQMIQTHVSVGKKIVESYNVVSDAVLRAILEHHERCDGTGYPFNKVQQKLQPVGQIIALCDTLYHLRFVKFKNSPRNMADIQPYLQLNSYTYFYTTYKAINAVYQRAKLTKNLNLEKESFSDFAQYLKERNSNLDTLHAQMRLLYQYLTQEKMKGTGLPVAKSIQNSLTVIAQSSVVGTEIGQWLNGINDQSFDDNALELQEFSAMQYELLFNIKRSFRYFEQFFAHAIKPNHSMHDLLNDLREEIKTSLEGAWATFEVYK